MSVRATDGAGNTTDQAISVSVTDVPEVSRSDPLSALLASTIYDLDATLAASYGGSGQTWSNLIASPADGALQTDYDYTLGFSASPSTDDPTFTGTADDANAHFSFDGGDRMVFTNGLPDFFKKFHRTDTAQDWTMVFAGKLPPSGSSFPFIRTGNSTAGAQGMQIAWQYSGVPRILLTQYGDAASSNFIETADIPSYGDEFVMGIAYNHTAGEITIWANSSAGTRTSFTFNAATADAATNVLFYTTAFPANGSIIRAASAFNAKLSDADFAAVAGHYELRHNRSYLV